LITVKPDASVKSGQTAPADQLPDPAEPPDEPDPTINLTPTSGPRP
jgi:hypothetical protein